MRRSVLVLALTVFAATVALGGLGLAQEIPPTQAGPEKGCEGIHSADDVQDPKTLPDAVSNNPNDEETIGPPPPNPSQGEENSAVKEVGNAHLCKLEGPPTEPGSSGR